MSPLLEIHDREVTASSAAPAPPDRPLRELKLARPPANALSPELLERLHAELRVAEGETAGVVLSGLPGMFSGGLDVPLLLTLDRPAIFALWQNFYRLLEAIAASRVPIVAAITGHAPAGGAVLTLLCDYRVMAAGKWKIGLNEVLVGLPLPPVLLRALTRLVGPRQAERLAVGGELIGVEEARAIGWVDEIAESPEAAVERAFDWCSRRAALPVAARDLTRERARADLRALVAAGGEAELAEVAESWWHDETQAALRALVDRLAKKG